MIELIWDAGFKRAYKKRIAVNEEEKDRFWKALNLFVKNPFSPRLRTHKLTGKLEGLWALSVSYDCRVVMKFLDNDRVLLIDIGNHDEVY